MKEETMEKSFHSVCRWTFNAGQGGFVPADIRPSWSADNLNSAGVVKLIKEKIAPRLPDHIVLGYELHYNNEIDEENAYEVSQMLIDAGMHLAMITPGAHIHFGYGGVASLDEKERRAAEKLGQKTVDLVYGPLRKTWYKDENQVPTLVIWNGSFGYDIASMGIQEMYRRLKESLAGLCEYENSKGGKLYIGIEPKPNEGHAAMLLPTVASVILMWRRIQDEYGLSLRKKGVNKEFGHSEMIGLDPVLDTIEEIDNDMLVHMHVNSQGYNDGILLGGPGKFDIDNGCRINGFTIAMAGLTQKAGYRRWKGHDMQPRPYDNEEQAIDRIIRSILSWEACEMAARDLKEDELMNYLQNRNTAAAEDLMRQAVHDAQRYFDGVYK
jgi:xylose isomerase